MFSIVIPLYNKEKYIRKTIDSILAQTYKEFEVLIVNDGSTDNSLNEVQQISDSRIKIINQRNSGVGAARNNGISHANYEWVAFIDGDDIWAPFHLSELKAIVEKHPSSGLIFTANEIFYGEYPNVLNDLNSDYQIRSVNYFLEPIGHTSSAAIRKSVFEEVGGFSNHKNGEDLEYWVKVALEYPVAYSNRVTSYYRRDTGGITDTVSHSVNRDYYRELKSFHDLSPSLGLLLDKSKQNPSLLEDP